MLSVQIKQMDKEMTIFMFRFKINILLVLLISCGVFADSVANKEQRVDPALLKDDTAQAAKDPNEPVVYYDISDQLDYDLDDDSSSLAAFEEALDTQINGFWEYRAGYRLQNDAHEKDMSINQLRMQLDVFAVRDWGRFHFKGDVYGSLVDEALHYQSRELNIAFAMSDDIDVKLGRQVLTWGTGDLLFLNDLFPKNWRAFFTGMDQEYLKDPSDAVRFTIYNDLANVDIVYTPKFDHDTYPNGEYLSYWNPMVNPTGGAFAGQNHIMHSDKPNDWFQDDEIAYRVYKNINNYELAFYGYHGYWKSPGGQNMSGQVIFPDLNVFGASIRGKFANGIGNLETAYYDSANDRNGENPMINNSELRFLAGYDQEIGKDFNLGFQYYLEHMFNYEGYTDGVKGLNGMMGLNMPIQRKKDRHLLTCRITKYMYYHMLRLSYFTYYSPNEKDVYMMPNISLKANDQVEIQVGANIFFGENDYSFFGQFNNNTNIYASVRYSF